MSLTLQLDGVLLYKCFRAACDVGGAIGRVCVDPGLPEIRATEPKWPGYCEADYASTRSVSADEDCATLVRKFGLSPALVARAGWAYDDVRNRLIMPIYGPLGERRGFVLRKILPEHPGAKALTYMSRTDDVTQSWYVPRIASKCREIVVVEDIPSAYRLMLEGIWTVAALGCSPSEAALDEMAHEARQTARTICFAFDADATSKAIKVSRDYGLRGKSRVLTLPKDIKDMTAEELREWRMNELS